MNSVIDAEIVVDDARRELKAAITTVRWAVAQRDDAARMLERAIAEEQAA